MFRGLKTLMHFQGERILALVLVPAFILGTLPQTACICADGHRKPFCKAAGSGLLPGGSSTNACTGCSCCQGRGTHVVRSCCRAVHGQPVSSVPGPMSGVAAIPGSCCHLLVEAPVPATTAAKVSGAAQHDWMVAVQLSQPLITVGKIRPAFELSDVTGPPPLDAVIVFQRLTI